MSLRIAGKSTFFQEEAGHSMTFLLCSMKAGTTILVQGWGGRLNQFEFDMNVRRDHYRQPEGQVLYNASRIYLSV